MKLKFYQKKLEEKFLICHITPGASSSHFGGGALSSVEIIATLFGKIMNFDKDNYKDVTRDRFILSKGHGLSCLLLYFKYFKYY